MYKNKQSIAPLCKKVCGDINCSEDPYCPLNYLSRISDFDIRFKITEKERRLRILDLCKADNEREIILISALIKIMFEDYEERGDGGSSYYDSVTKSKIAERALEKIINNSVVVTKLIKRCPE